MMSPKVSIIVPCYNQAQYLDEALQSVLDQTYQNWECIIVNDGSSDNTNETAKKWLLRDDRFVYLYKDNGGLSSARNCGLDFAKGDYVQFLDCDDCLSNSKLTVSIKELVANQNLTNDLVISNFRMFKNNYQNSTDPYCELKLEFFSFDSVLHKWDESFSIPIHCGLFRSSLFNNFRFPEQLKAKEDWIMWVYLFDRQAKAVFIDLPLAFYRLHPQSMTKTKNMLIDYLNAYEHLIYMLPEEEQLKLSRNLIARFYSLNKISSAKIAAIKSSNTYRTGRFQKKILKKIKLLRIATYVFNYFKRK